MECPGVIDLIIEGSTMIRKHGLVLLPSGSLGVVSSVVLVVPGFIEFSLFYKL